MDTIGKPNKPDYSKLNSFRLTSLVGNLSKILENIVLGRLSWMLQNSEWLSHTQLAFNSTWHPAIIVALGKRLCPPYLMKIVSSFLWDRKAVFSINNEFYVKSVHIGCPKGGVLSPYLWNLLVDDHRRLASLQRKVTRFFSCAFKTAPTDFILISNLLPLNYLVIEVLLIAFYLAQTNTLSLHLNMLKKPRFFSPLTLHTQFNLYSVL